MMSYWVRYVTKENGAKKSSAVVKNNSSYVWIWIIYKWSKYNERKQQNQWITWKVKQNGPLGPPRAMKSVSMDATEHEVIISQIIFFSKLLKKIECKKTRFLIQIAPPHPIFRSHLYDVWMSLHIWSEKNDTRIWWTHKIFSKEKKQKFSTFFLSNTCVFHEKRLLETWLNSYIRAYCANTPSLIFVSHQTESMRPGNRLIHFCSVGSVKIRTLDHAI